MTHSKFVRAPQSSQITDHLTSLRGFLFHRASFATRQFIVFALSNQVESSERGDRKTQKRETKLFLSENTHIRAHERTADVSVMGKPTRFELFSAKTVFTFRDHLP